MLTFNHFNFNVADLDKSLKFYKDALDLEPVGRKDAPDGRFTIVYLGDGKTDFRLELTWLRDHPQKYDLGSASSIWPCGRTTMRRPTSGTPRWGASALRIRRWGFTSSRTPTVTGLRSFPPGDFCSGVPLFRKERRGDLAAVRDCKETPCGWP